MNSRVYEIKLWAAFVTPAKLLRFELLGSTSKKLASFGKLFGDQSTVTSFEYSEKLFIKYLNFT